MSAASIQKALKAVRNRLAPAPAWYRNGVDSLWWVTDFTHTQMDGNREACLKLIDKALAENSKQENLP